jgi:hypothetical protein
VYLRPWSLLVVVAVVGAVLAGAPAAGAGSLPPTSPFATTVRGVHALHLVRATERGVIERTQPRSCMANHTRGHTTVGAIERKVAPVACEQPPRSNLLPYDLGGHTAFGAAAALVAP